MISISAFPVFQRTNNGFQRGHGRRLGRISHAWGKQGQDLVKLLKVKVGLHVVNDCCHNKPATRTTARGNMFACGIEGRLLVRRMQAHVTYLALKAFSPIVPRGFQSINPLLLARSCHSAFLSATMRVESSLRQHVTTITKRQLLRFLEDAILDVGCIPEKWTSPMKRGGKSRLALHRESPSFGITPLDVLLRTMTDIANRHNHLLIPKNNNALILRMLILLFLHRCTTPKRRD